MSELFAADFLFRNALLGGLLVCSLCALLGVYLVLRRLVLLGVALPQAGAAGIALLFWLAGHSHAPGEGAHLTALTGSLGVTLAALAALVWAERRSRLPAEWRVGALLAVASAATLLCVALDPTGDLEMTNLLRGELLAISDGDLRILAGSSALTLALFLVFRREIFLTSFDREFARTLGLRTERHDALLYLLLGVTIAIGVMSAGPLVVFGFLVLPPLAALQLAPGLAAAFVLAAAIGAICSVGGFALAYGSNLPAGPTSVALAAAVWLLASLLRRLRRGRRAATLALLALALLGCAGVPAATRGERRGALAAPDPAVTIAVLPFLNATGQRLRIPGANPVGELGRAAGDPFAPRGASVADALQELAGAELARRGHRVLDAGQTRAAVGAAPSDPAAAAAAARRAGLAGPVLFGALRRFTLSGDQLLLVRLELVLLDARSGAVLWSGSAHRPVPVRSALTVQQLLIDAGPRIFAEAFDVR